MDRQRWCLDLVGLAPKTLFWVTHALGIGNVPSVYRLNLPTQLNQDFLDERLGSIEINWQDDNLTLVIPWGMESVETLLEHLDVRCGGRTYGLKVILGQECRQLFEVSMGIEVSPGRLDQIGGGIPRDQYPVGDLSRLGSNCVNLDFLGLTQLIQDDISVLIGGSARTVVPMRLVTLPFSPSEFRFTPENLGWALNQDELLPLWKLSPPRLLLPWDNQQASLIVREVISRFSYLTNLEAVSLMGSWAHSFRLLFSNLEDWSLSMEALEQEVSENLVG